MTFLDLPTERQPRGGTSTPSRAGIVGAASAPSSKPAAPDDRPAPALGPGSSPPDRRRTRAVRWRTVFVVAYLLLQVTLPLRGFLREKLETRGNFSWNMYSQLYTCNARYVLLTASGQGLWIDQREYSRDPDRITTVFRSDWLPAFNGWLCDELGRQGRYGTLKARVRCAHDLGPRVELVEPYREVCVISEPGVESP
jgi:hypothetical protein